MNVRSENGTELTFEVAWREWNFDDNGICNRPKMVMNLPAGKVFIMPREGTMNGRLVMDGSWEGTLIDEPVTLEIEQGVIASITGGEMASRIRKEFQDAAEPLRPKDQDVAGTVAEFGFGMNPAATLTGSVLEDENASAPATSCSETTRQEAEPTAWASPWGDAGSNGLVGR